jgi:pyruvate kinase
MNLPSKKTKIVCTIGPASQEQAMIERMIANGMNVARINFAHGDYATHARAIANVRAAAAVVGERVAIMGDLPGPKMRIGELATETVDLVDGQPIILQTEPIIGDSRRISLSFTELPGVVKPGDRIYLNDGYLQLQVNHVSGDEVHCTVVAGGELRARKGVNFPGIDLGISAFTEQDRELLAFAAEQQVDAVSQSFVQGPRDIETVRQAAAALNYHPFIIAKLELASAVHQLDAILQRADGIMVARGDLGVELPIEEVTIIQKQMIRQANRYGKPVITATHMLESMIEHRRPTRAETTDVANAILDGTDCLMLSGETAIGINPDEAVAVMTRIAIVTENQPSLANNMERLFATDEVKRTLEQADRTALSVYHSARDLSPVIIITPTESGSTARRLARFRLPQWIVAMSRHAATGQTLQFSYGVYPIHNASFGPDWEEVARQWCQEQGLSSGIALLTEGTSPATPGTATRVSILYL